MGSLLYLVSLPFQAEGCIILSTSLESVVFDYGNIIHVSSSRIGSQIQLQTSQPRLDVSLENAGRQKGTDRQLSSVMGNRLICLTLLDFRNHSQPKFESHLSSQPKKSIIRQTDGNCPGAHHGVAPGNKTPAPLHESPRSDSTTPRTVPAYEYMHISIERFSISFVRQLCQYQLQWGIRSTGELR